MANALKSLFLPLRYSVIIAFPMAVTFLYVIEKGFVVFRAQGIDVLWKLWV